MEDTQDLQQIIELLDTALTSDDQRIKDALRRFMTVVILFNADNPSQALQRGPLKKLFDEHQQLMERIYRLEQHWRVVEIAKGPIPQTWPTPPPNPFVILPEE